MLPITIQCVSPLPARPASAERWACPALRRLRSRPQVRVRQHGCGCALRDRRQAARCQGRGHRSSSPSAGQAGRAAPAQDDTGQKRDRRVTAIDAPDRRDHRAAAPRYVGPRRCGTVGRFPPYVGDERASRARANQPVSAATASDMACQPAARNAAYRASASRPAAPRALRFEQRWDLHQLDRGVQRGEDVGARAEQRNGAYAASAFVSCASQAWPRPGDARRSRWGVRHAATWAASRGAAPFVP